MNHSSPILSNTTKNNFHLKNQINGRIPRISVIDTEKIKPRDLCYQCSKYGSDCLSDKLRIREFNDDPHLPLKSESISIRIQMNTLSKTNSERKISRCDKS